MKRLMTAALLASTVAAHAGIPAGGLTLLLSGEGMLRGALLQQVDAAEERLACEAIVCVSLISSPDPDCSRSLSKVSGLDVAGRVAFLGTCRHAKWFDLNELAERPSSSGGGTSKRIDGKNRR